MMHRPVHWGVLPDKVPIFAQAIGKNGGWWNFLRIFGEIPAGGE
jgi:hypothetical protein